MCKTCDVTLKDSNRYLLHVNSRAHQRKIGVSMRVKRSSREEVREAFERAKRETEARKGGERRSWAEKAGTEG